MKHFLQVLLAVGCTVLASCVSPIEAETIPQNEALIRAVNKMPRGGGYATNRKAHARLSQAVQVYTLSGLRSSPRKAKPSYCSGATYLVLLEMVEEALVRGDFELTQEEAVKLLVHGQADGHGVWGRWNANGPGAAKLVKDLDMGINFESYEKAHPGDFMKIFWTDEIGKKEFGHLVVYLGSFTHEGEEYVRFWSSNKPHGYGVKAVPKDRIRWAVFTRVTQLENIKRAKLLPARDRYLENMLKKRYTRSSVRKKCRVKG